VALLGYGDRIRRAILDRAAHLGRRYTNVEFASDVGLAERGKPYTPAAVGEWLAERSEPSITTFRVIAKLTGKDAAWLMALDADPFAGDSFEELPREEFTDEDDDMPDALPAKKRAGGKKRR